MRVLAIDPSLRGTGYAILETAAPAVAASALGARTRHDLADDPVPRQLPAGATAAAAILPAPRVGRGVARACEYGTIKNKSDLLPSSCLVAIHDRLAELIYKYAPDCCAVEGVIFVQSHRTAITLGAARGAAVLAAAERGLAIYEYAPRLVKQAVVGRGAADKTQVAFMVRALLGLTETPPPDAADALAIGLTHLRAQENPAARAAFGALVRI
ncbi:MAG: crossover junction endodeoxyribonuclease RuvC [Verrucomicrobia bacterium]|nr:crossover junction endodeoxyribonuclease RuvC [Verrucomicrobiota bacterium]